MAIVINGNGSISGISVGGLPDGTVDAGTLATNSVDSAELIDGAVDDSHIAALAASKLTGALPAISGASLTGFTDAQMPAGSVIQVVTRSSDATASSQTANQWNTTDTYVNITPSATSSKILVIVGGGQMFVTAVDGRASATIYRDSTNLGDVNHGFTNGYAASSTVMIPFAGIAVLDSPSSTSQITYKVYSKSDRASDYNYDGTLATVTALEIAG
jgi:hypothetical protein